MHIFTEGSIKMEVDQQPSSSNMQNNQPSTSTDSRQPEFLGKNVIYLVFLLLLYFYNFYVLEKVSVFHLLY